ncbi:MAG TPA: beta-galactosidase [Actinomycetota bacterium]|nr:beta-galactosidase [Actinomycetota bacterium]
MTIAFTHRGISVDGVERTWLSAEAHAWRLEPDVWPRVLDAVAANGFGFVSTYVPWARHEREPGRFDFTGRLDLRRFCELAHERGLGVMVRPGPDAASEITDSGWPVRILDDPRFQARRPDGRPYVLPTATWHVHPPSYASRAFLEEVARWYDAFCEQVAPLQHPDGPVVACQVDNELGYHFQPHAFAMDYHPDAVEDWRGWVERRYDGRPPYDVTDPPRDAADGTELSRLDWVSWREHHLRDALGKLAGMLRERGMTVPLVHNDYPRLTTPQDLGALERSGAVDVAAADIYATRHGGRYVRDLARHMSGSTRLPFLIELGAGWLTLPWLLPLGVDERDERIIGLRAVYSGVRAANVYMAVERDRWYGSPISRHGEERPKVRWYGELAGHLDRLRGLRRHAPVLLLENRTESRRVAARATLGDLVPAFSQVLPLDRRLFELDHPDTRAFQRWETGLAAACDAVGVDCDRASTSSMPDLTRYRTVLVPMLDAFDPEVWEALRAAAAQGVRVGVGPRLPRIDDRLEPHAFEHRGITLLGQPSDAEALLPAPPYAREPTCVDLHVWEGDDRTVLAAFNSSDDPVAATVRGDGGTWRFRIDAWDAQVWEVRS